MTEENSQLKNARPPVKVQNERRMASFFVWMARSCRAVLMHRTRWSFLGRRRDKETKRQRDEKTKRRRVKETERRREFEQGLNRGWSMVGQWLVNGWCCFSWKAWQKTGCLVRRFVRVRFCTRLSCIFLTFSSRCHQVGEEKGRCGVERCQ